MSSSILGVILLPQSRIRPPLLLSLQLRLDLPIRLWVMIRIIYGVTSFPGAGGQYSAVSRFRFFYISPSAIKTANARTAARLNESAFFTSSSIFSNSCSDSRHPIATLMSSRPIPLSSISSVIFLTNSRTADLHNVAIKSILTRSFSYNNKLKRTIIANCV